MCYLIWSSDLIDVSKRQAPQPVHLEYRVVYCTEESGYWNETADRYLAVPHVSIQERMTIGDRPFGWSEVNRTKIIPEELKSKEFTVLPQ